jgi:hypothetical protein
MEYFHCLWIHKDTDDPVVLVFEIDDDRYEVRKVEIWRSGQIGWAGRDSHTENTGLGEGSIPSLEEINVEPVFSAVKITKEEFENYWRLATSNTV